MSVVRITLPELAERLRFPHEREELSTAVGVRAVVVDLTGTHRVPALPDPEFVDRLAQVATLTIAVRTDPHDVAADAYADEFDIVVAASDPTALTEVLDGASRSPIAAATFALLLRSSERRSTTDGLLAESLAYSVLQAGPEFAEWRESRPVRHRPKEIGPAVLTERDGTELRITLARPHVHNAFSTRLRDGLVHALEIAVADPDLTRVVLDGAGPSFCSGGDLDEFGSFPDPAQAHLIRLARHAGRLIDELGDRVEVHLHGAAMGSGIELAAFAGRVVAAPDTEIALPELALGLVPGAGGTVSLPRRIGRQRTAWLGITGARITAHTALAWGLIDAVSG